LKVSLDIVLIFFGIQFDSEHNRFAKRFRPTLYLLVLTKVKQVFLRFESVLLISWFHCWKEIAKLPKFGIDFVNVRALEREKERETERGPKYTHRDA